MKRKLHLLIAAILIVLHTNLQSQIVLNSNEFLPVGSSYVLTPIQNFTLVDTTIQGPNVVWNFASFQAGTTSNMTITIVNPSQTTYSSSVPNSNYCYVETPTLAYRYYTKTATTYDRVGSWMQSGGLKTWSDPQTELIFPFAYGSENMDTWINSASSFGGTYELKCVGAGKLILPNQTYNNVLLARVRVKEAFLNIVSYQWYHADNGAILMYYIPGDGMFVARQGFFLTSLTVGINENEEIKDFVFNNPVMDELQLKFKHNTPQKIKYSIVNSLGVEVYSQMSDDVADESVTAKFYTGNLSRGIYFLSVVSMETGTVLKTAKFIKQ
jgi:hypothetical protein